MFDSIVTLLLPHCETEAQRRMLITFAFTNSPEILGKTDYAGNSFEFTARLIKMLQAHGEIAPQTQSLWHLLTTLKAFVGSDVQTQIDALKDYANTLQPRLADSDSSFRLKITKPIFISYSRANRPFAEDLRQTLIALGFTVWRDVHEMQVGDDWWRQITDALAGCHTMVLCMSPAAIASSVVGQEWQVARQMGVRVMPVIAEDVDFSVVPRWMSRKDWADFRPGRPEHEAVWQRFIHQLNNEYDARRVPFMVEALPSDFVPRPNEFEPIVQALVDRTHGAVALTTALKGAGGYGKTTLARAVCHDMRVRGAFDDGILWVTLGEKVSEGDLIHKVLDLVVTLKSVRPSVTTLETARDELKKAIGDGYLLLVIDDMWQSYHAVPFLELGRNVATLITTRNSGALPHKTLARSIDAMTRTEAVQLLRTNLSDGEDAALMSLAARLGEWPLLLKMANRALLNRIGSNETLPAALAWINKALGRKGFDALINADNPNQRHTAVSATLEVSLSLLSGAQRNQYERLAIFPEDIDIPLQALETLWGIDDLDAEDVCQQLISLSLLLNYDLLSRTIRLHDVIRTYLRDLRSTNLVEWNRSFLRAYQTSEWYTLSTHEMYLWQQLTYHLSEAGQLERLRVLLLDYRWLQAKLNVTDINALISDCAYLPDDDTIHLVKSALSMSTHVLSENKDQLPYQLTGRLWTHRERPDISPLWHSCHVATPLEFIETQDYPPMLQAGGMLLRVFEGHLGPVAGAATFPDGRILSWSGDHTLRLWSKEGVPMAVLKGHTDKVVGALLLQSETQDGGHILSWSPDGTWRLWTVDGRPLTILEDESWYSTRLGAIALESGAFLTWKGRTLRMWSNRGQLITAFEGHSQEVRGASMLPGGRILSWSDDYTLRLWTINGDQEAVLSDHQDRITNAFVLKDGRVLSWSAIARGHDTNVRLWNHDGELLATVAFGQHKESSCGIIVLMGMTQLPDGRVLSWAEDPSAGGRLLQLWSFAEQERPTVEDVRWVWDVKILPDKRIATIGLSIDDYVLRLWSADFQPLTIMEGHKSPTQGIVATSDGNFVSWTRDNKLRLWSSTGESLLVMDGHTDNIKSVLSLASGHFLSWSDDHTLRLWSWDGKAQKRLHAHNDSIQCLSLSDGHFISWVRHEFRTEGELVAWLWSADGKILRGLEHGESGIRDMISLLDGRLLSWGERELRLWSSAGDLLTVISAYITGAISLSDGRILSWYRDNLCLWSTQGDLLVTMSLPRRLANSSRFATREDDIAGAIALSNGTLLPWGAKSLHLWSSEGESLTELEGHTGKVRGVLEVSGGRFVSWSKESETKQIPLPIEPSAKPGPSPFESLFSSDSKSDASPFKPTPSDSKLDPSPFESTPPSDSESDASSSEPTPPSTSKPDPSPFKSPFSFSRNVTRPTLNSLPRYETVVIPPTLHLWSPEGKLLASLEDWLKDKIALQVWCEAHGVDVALLSKTDPVARIDRNRLTVTGIGDVIGDADFVSWQVHGQTIVVGDTTGRLLFLQSQSL